MSFPDLLAAAQAGLRTGLVTGAVVIALLLLRKLLVEAFGDTRK